jgi:hypothetical protein
MQKQELLNLVQTHASFRSVPQIEAHALDMEDDDDVVEVQMPAQPPQPDKHVELPAEKNEKNEEQQQQQQQQHPDDDGKEQEKHVDTEPEEEEQKDNMVHRVRMKIKQPMLKLISLEFFVFALLALQAVDFSPSFEHQPVLPLQKFWELVVSGAEDFPQHFKMFDGGFIEKNSDGTCTGWRWPAHMSHAPQLWPEVVTFLTNVQENDWKFSDIPARNTQDCDQRSFVSPDEVRPHHQAFVTACLTQSSNSLPRTNFVDHAAVLDAPINAAFIESISSGPRNQAYFQDAANILNTMKFHIVKDLFWFRHDDQKLETLLLKNEYFPLPQPHHPRGWHLELGTKIALAKFISNHRAGPWWRTEESERKNVFAVFFVDEEHAIPPELKASVLSQEHQESYYEKLAACRVLTLDDENEWAKLKALAAKVFFSNGSNEHVFFDRSTGKLFWFSIVTNFVLQLYCAQNNISASIWEQRVRNFRGRPASLDLTAEFPFQEILRETFEDENHVDAFLHLYFPLTLSVNAYWSFEIRKRPERQKVAKTNEDHVNEDGNDRVSKSRKRKLSE